MNDLNFWKVNVFENIKMMITGYNIFGTGDDSTINEFVVVRINSDEVKTVSWLYGNDKGGNSKKIDQTISIFLAMQRRDNFFVLQNYRGGHASKETPCH